MSLRRAILGWVILGVLWFSPAVAQDSLGDLVQMGGYDWLIGAWEATTDQGDKVQFEYAWTLDKHAMMADVTMGDFKFRGMIMYVSSREEILQMGIDNKGGIWEGAWYEDYAGAVYKVTHTQADGQTQKAELVHSKVGADGMKVAMYGLDSDGYRSSQPWAELTYKRRPKSTGVSSSGSGSSGYSDQDTLGDLIGQYGYEWLIGNWRATDDNGQTYKLNWKWALDKNAIMLELKTDESSYIGMIAFNASGEEVIQFGADNRGRTMKGTWGEGYQGATLRSEILMPDGASEKIEHVFSKVDGNSLKVVEYAVESDGWRASSPRGQVTFKRQK